MGSAFDDLYTATLEGLDKSEIMDMLSEIKQEPLLDPWTDDVQQKIGVDILPVLVQVKESVCS
jgi:hypothetical protein